MINCLRSVALGVLTMMLPFMTIKTVALVGRTGMNRTGCSGETGLALQIPGSSCQKACRLQLHIIITAASHEQRQAQTG